MRKNKVQKSSTVSKVQSSSSQSPSRDVSNRTVLALLLATLAISIGGTFISLSTINSRLAGAGFEPITGFALIPNGTATLNIASTASIIFTADTVAFGSGSVNGSSGRNNCTLSTLPGPYGSNAGCDGFNELNNGFTVENDGNVNLSVDMRSNVTAITFIGDLSAEFRWNVTLNETGACVNGTGSRSAVSPNTTSDDDCGCAGPACDCGAIFESVTTSNKIICPSLLFDDTKDSLNIDINITMPVTSPQGGKVAGLIVTGTTET